MDIGLRYFPQPWVRRIRFLVGVARWFHSTLDKLNLVPKKKKGYPICIKRVIVGTVCVLIVSFGAYKFYYYLTGGAQPQPPAPAVLPIPPPQVNPYPLIALPAAPPYPFPIPLNGAQPYPFPIVLPWPQPVPFAIPLPGIQPVQIPIPLPQADVYPFAIALTWPQGGVGVGHWPPPGRHEPVLRGAVPAQVAPEPEINIFENVEGLDEDEYFTADESFVEEN